MACCLRLCTKFHNFGLFLDCQSQRDSQISVIIYGINIIIAGIWINVRWWYATKDHRLVESNLDLDLIKMMSRSFLIAPIVYLVAVAVSFASIEISYAIYIATPLYYLIPVRKDKSWFWFTKSR